MNDRLDKIFEMQKSLNDEIVETRGLSKGPTDEWIQRQILAMISELAEVMDEVNFKWWKNKKPINSDNLKEEIVDVFHFFVSMCLTAGMDAEELYQRYLAKNAENFNRQHGTSSKEGYALRDAESAIKADCSGELK